MEFESEGWDIGKEARDLDRSLFEKRKKSKKKDKAKSATAQNVFDKTDTAEMPARKKQKTFNNTEDKTDSTEISGVSKGLTRKERRQLQWEEKIKRKKIQSQTGHQEKPTEFNKEPKVEKKDLSEVRDKNSSKHGTLVESKTKVLTGHNIEQSVPKLGKDMSKSKSNSGNAANNIRVTGAARKGDDDDIKSSAVEASGELSKKERKNLRRKRNKLLKKLEISKNAATTDLNEGEDKDNRHKKETSKRFAAECNVSNVKLKQNSTKHKDRSYASGDCEVKCNLDEINEGMSTSKKLRIDDSSSHISQNGSVVQKKKRKRKCKKNKFKDYVQTESSNSEQRHFVDDKDETDKTVESSTQQERVKPTTHSEMLENSLGESKVQVTSKNKKKKQKEKPPNANETKSNNVVKPESQGKGKKGDSRRHSLDPKVLSSLLKSRSVAEEGILRNVADVDENIVVDGKQQRKSLLEKSWQKLNAARFRYLNEQLYTTTGQEALKMFRNDERAFQVYHEGFQGQVEKWPTNPLDKIIEQLKAKPKHLVIADFGCGDAKLARSVPNTVHSFDLVALNEHVTVCDMAKVPLQTGSIDIAVFCLSLMGTNLSAYLQEGNRVLKNNGTLLIAEVTSRFNSIGSFILQVEKMGFKIKQQDAENKMFVMMEFKKTSTLKTPPMEDLQLKPCVYKKR